MASRVIRPFNEELQVFWRVRVGGLRFICQFAPSWRQHWLALHSKNLAFWYFSCQATLVWFLHRFFLRLLSQLLFLHLFSFSQALTQVSFLHFLLVFPQSFLHFLTTFSQLFIHCPESFSQVLPPLLFQYFIPYWFSLQVRFPYSPPDLDPLWFSPSTQV